MGLSTNKVTETSVCLFVCVLCLLLWQLQIQCLGNEFGWNYSRNNNENEHFAWDAQISVNIDQSPDVNTCIRIIVPIIQIWAHKPPICLNPWYNNHFDSNGYGCLIIENENNVNDGISLWNDYSSLENNLIFDNNGNNDGKYLKLECQLLVMDKKGNSNKLENICFELKRVENYCVDTGGKIQAWIGNVHSNIDDTSINNTNKKTISKNNKNKNKNKNENETTNEIVNKSDNIYVNKSEYICNYYFMCLFVMITLIILVIALLYLIHCIVGQCRQAQTQAPRESVYNTATSDEEVFAIENKWINWKLIVSFIILTGMTCTVAFCLLQIIFV